MPGWVLLLCWVITALACVGWWLDRRYWQQKYDDLCRSSQAREADFLDRLLKRNGIAPLRQPQAPQLVERPKEVDYSDYDDRLLEREEAGLLTTDRRQYLMAEAREKRLSKEELDLALWSKPNVDGQEFDEFL